MLLLLYCLERHKSPTYIRKDQLNNQTAIVGENVTFKCSIVSDIAASKIWAKYLAPNDNEIDTNFVKQLNKIRIKV